MYINTELSSQIPMYYDNKEGEIFVAINEILCRLNTL